MSTPESIISSLSDVARTHWEQIGRVVKASAPEAEVAISYGALAYKLQGKPLIGFAAQKQHYSIYPFSPGVIERLRIQLADYELSKGTIKLQLDQAMSDELLTDIIQVRQREIEAL